MLSNIKNIFKVHDLRNKLLFTFMIVALYRVGASIRVPGVDPLAIDQLREGAQGGALGLFNLFSGGAFESFSVFALGIMPYITASIIPRRRPSPSSGPPRPAPRAARRPTP